MRYKTLPLLLFFICMNVMAAVPPPIPIDSLDLKRYMGVWYEIARYEKEAKEKCVGFTQMEYTLRDDGSVQVLKRCLLENGERTEIEGTAEQVGESNSPKLRVRFTPAWFSFITDNVWEDYWVIDLDEEYQLAVVSNSNKSKYSILSRTPTVAPEVYKALLERMHTKTLAPILLKQTFQ